MKLVINKVQAAIIFDLLANANYKYYKEMANSYAEVDAPIAAGLLEAYGDIIVGELSEIVEVDEGEWSWENEGTEELEIDCCHDEETGEAI